MEKTFAQARLVATIEQSGMNDAQLAAALGVDQSTVSRLKNGKIAKVSKHQRKLDEYLGLGTKGRPDELSELMVMAELSPALREALIALQRLMRESA
jgi:ribosome-binding protein aMBF1 (putative translation factor)